MPEKKIVVFGHYLYLLTFSGYFLKQLRVAKFGLRRFQITLFFPIIGLFFRGFGALFGEGVISIVWVVIEIMEIEVDDGGIRMHLMINMIETFSNPIIIQSLVEALPITHISIEGVNYQKFGSMALRWRR